MKITTICKYVDMTSKELEACSEQSYQYAVTKDNKKAMEQYRKMFNGE